MRKSRLILLIAVTIVSGSLIGQQEALPPIQVKSSDSTPSETLNDSALASQFPEPIIDLPVEPLLNEQSPTLEDAARRNDFATFDALFSDANARGDAEEFSALHDLWTYSVTDRLGAFYGKDMHDRLARAYSGYAGYIEQYRIVDDRGNVYYPTAETKTYLLQQALLGKEPSVQIASSRRAAPRGGVTSEEVQRSMVRPSRKRLQKVESAPAAAAPLPEPVAPPVVVQASTEPPNVIAAPAPAPAAAPAPVATQQPVQAQLVITTPAPEQQSQSAFNARAIIVAIMLFIAVGVLMVMLRTSREERQHVLIPPAKPVVPQAEAKPIAPVAPPLDNIEPIRKPSSRASGSHG